MQISQLSKESGVPVATIKYYLREGLLHPGQKLTERLAEYDQSHLRRLGLIRVLRELGDVPIDRLRALVVVAEGGAGTVHERFAAASEALAPIPAPAGPQRELTRQVGDDLIARAGWTEVAPDSVDRDNLATVLEAILRYGTHAPGIEEALPYLEVADLIARYEIGHLDASNGRVELLEEMVVGQVVFGQLLSVLRRLAEEHYSVSRFGSDPGQP